MFIYFNFREFFDHENKVRIISLVCGLFLLLLLFIFVRAKNDKFPPVYFPLVCLISVFCALLWNKLCSDYLVAIFRGLGFIFGVPVPYLGNVFLSIGNALPDGLTQISLAKLGQAKMGITGGLASHLFAFLIGFGFSSVLSLLATEEGKPRSMKFNLTDMKFLKENPILIVALTIILFNQFFAIFSGFISKFNLTKKYGAF